ncbi:MAG TPA: hypothetical protein VGK02_03495 [Candidatus Aquicultor sp.]
MLVYLTLGSTLLFISAAWPPYNVYIADALVRKDRLTVVLIVLAAFFGLMVPTTVIVAGASLASIPLGKIGGAFVLFTGIRMFFKHPESEVKTGEEARTKTNREAIVTSLLISMVPGIYAVLAAEGITKHDLLQTVIVFICGPTGVLLGGLLLAYGIRFINLPIDKIGGVLIVLISLKMMFF